ncbi:MAG: MEDS domain-containing protein [Candidatus Omnitrophota bacterium]
MEPVFRKSGIDVVGEIPWGTHFCQFYQTSQDLSDILVPYFQSGLENNEFCMWVTSESLTKEKAEEELGKAAGDLAKYLKRGQIEIVDYRDWYLKDGRFDPQRVLKAWVEKQKRALRAGFEGLRLSGNTVWLERSDWRKFAEYEEEVNKYIGKYRMIALCTYSLDACLAKEVIDVVRTHEFAIIKREDGRWEALENSDRKKAREALLETRQRMDSILDSVTDGFCSFDRDWRYCYVNSSAARILNKESRELLGRVLWDVWPRASESLFGREFRRCVREKIPLKFEAFYPDPLKRWFDVRCYPSEAGMSIFFNDITEHRRTLEALRQGQEDLNRAQAVANTGSWRLDVRSNELLWSDETHRIFSIPKGTPLTYDTFLAAVYPADRSFVDSSWKAALRGKPYDIVHRIVAGNEVKWIRQRAELEFDKEGQLLGGFGTAQDITEIKQSAEKLKESEQRFKSLAENLPSILVRYDRELRIIYGNPKAEEFLTAPARDFIGKNIRELNLPEEVCGLWGEAVRKAFRSGKGDELEFEVSFLQGRKTFDLKLSPETDSRGDVKYVLGIATDVTERKKAEEVLKRDKETFERLVTERTEQLVDIQLELEKAKRLSDIGTLAATIAHELRNPLAAINMAVSNIKRKASRAPIERHLHNIEKRVTESDQIINNLLFYSRLKPPQLEYVNIGQILEECAHAVQKQDKKKINFSKSLACVRSAFIEADPFQMKEVFFNILNNAYDAAPSLKGKIELRAEQKEECLRIFLEDNGPGIREEDLTRIFDPFFTTKARGTGLGLSVCRQIVTMHGGTIRIQSSPGDGTRVEVILPKEKKRKNEEHTDYDVSIEALQ